MSFQNRINMDPAQGWHGDFASTNPRVSLLGKDGGYQVGTSPIQAGSFVWVNEHEGTLSNSGNGSPAGFVPREFNGVIVSGTGENNMILLTGMMVTVFEKGEFLVELPETIEAVHRGDTVSVSSESGAISIASDKNSVVTIYKCVENANAGDLVKISAWI